MVVNLDLPNQPIESVSESFLQLTGYTAREVIGRNCRFMQGPDSDTAEIALMRDAIRRYKPIVVLLKNYTKKGLGFWNLLTLEPMVGGFSRKMIAFQQSLSSMEAIRVKHKLREERGPLPPLTISTCFKEDRSVEPIGCAKCKAVVPHYEMIQHARQCFMWDLERELTSAA